MEKCPIMDHQMENNRKCMEAYYTVRVQAQDLGFRVYG